MTNDRLRMWVAARDVNGRSQEWATKLAAYPPSFGVRD
jgi:hypothetical protein